MLSLFYISFLPVICYSFYYYTMIGIQSKMGHGSVHDDVVYPRGWPKAIQQMQLMAEIEPSEVAEDVEYIAPHLPEQHRRFHTSNISFLPLATKDSNGRVWASILTGKEGSPGFITSEDPRWLQIHADTWKGDPITRSFAAKSGNSDVNELVAGVGVELWSRRRNKLAGVAKKIEWTGARLDIDVRINEAMGNCPKYITIRGLEPYPRSQPSIADENLDMSANDVLTDAVINFVKSRDTVYLATSYIPKGASDPTLAHLGCNTRGGRPGFIRVREDKRTLVLPDFSGNRHMSSLGNMLTDSHVGLVFPCFETGDVLYLTGEGRTVVGDEAKAIMPRARAVISLFKITGYTLVRNALPFRQSVDAPYEPSPYNPPIRYLVEEQEISAQQDLKAKLTSIDFHRSDESIPKGESDLATFTFETSAPISIKAGQYAVLDATPLVGMNTYMHMSRGNEQAPNDDGIRTWTIARPPASSNPREFSITIRRVASGRVSSRLFSFGAYWDTKRRDPSGGFVPGLTLPLLGVGGTFLLPQTPSPLLLLAGGIGITPFLAFLRDITSQKTPSEIWDVELAVSTREPAILVDLLYEAIQGTAESLRLKLHLFTSASFSSEGFKLPNTSIQVHNGRLSAKALKDIGTLPERRAYLCGPPSFESAALLALNDVGVKEVDVTRESFAF